MDSSDSVQDYLKTIYSLAESGKKVTTSAMAQRLGVSPASVTAMIKRLHEGGYLTHRRYKGVELTAAGRRVALEVIRHHRLLEAYLHKTLGIPWDKVHDEAEVLEHALSEELEDRISEFLGNPSIDPHGDPIPPKQGRHNEVHYSALDQIAEGPARVERVSDRNPDALRFLGKLGIKPGVKLVVEKGSEFQGAVWVRVGGKRHPIGAELASNIYLSGPTS